MTQHPGDDRRSAHFRAPEIIAAEQRILTYADALLTWMRQQSYPPEWERKLEGFMTHKLDRNPGLQPMLEGTTTYWILEKLDPDANRLFMDLMRSAWELRRWKAHWGEEADRT